MTMEIRPAAAGPSRRAPARATTPYPLTPADLRRLVAAMVD